VIQPVAKDCIEKLHSGTDGGHGYARRHPAAAVEHTPRHHWLATDAEVDALAEALVAAADPNFHGALVHLLVQVISQVAWFGSDARHG
jgi:hypothetical protein